jgi:hypothetical protein
MLMDFVSKNMAYLFKHFSIAKKNVVAKQSGNCIL